MKIVRPIQESDLDALYDMAGRAGVGVTTLPADREVLQTKIDRAVRSFRRQCRPEEAFYLFALEDVASGKCIGVSGLEARVGLDDVWYNYRVSTSVNASKELGIHVQTPTLYLTNDMTGCSELCSLFLHPDFRGDGNGPLISRSRFLFLAEFREVFADKVFAEMRGYSDADGRSPFWEALGRKFFHLDFSYADYLTGLGNKAFIAELMPKHPIYLPFLSAAAREVVGKVHENTFPALRMLQNEGLNYNGLVDIFDAGPVIEGFVGAIRAVRDSLDRHAMVVRDDADDDMGEGEGDDWVLISNRAFAQFRVGMVRRSALKRDTVSVPAALAQALQIVSGDLLRIVPLKPAGGRP